MDPSIDCDFAARGQTDEEVMEKMMEHAKMYHPEKIKGMSENEMKEMMKPMIKEE